MKRDDRLLPAEAWAFLLVFALAVSPNVVKHVKTSPAHEGTRAAAKAISDFVTPNPVNTFVRGVSQ